MPVRRALLPPPRVARWTLLCCLGLCRAGLRGSLAVADPRGAEPAGGIASAGTGDAAVQARNPAAGAPDGGVAGEERNGTAVDNRTNSSQTREEAEEDEKHGEAKDRVGPRKRSAPGRPRKSTVTESATVTECACLSRSECKCSVAGEALSNETVLELREALLNLTSAMADWWHSDDRDSTDCLCVGALCHCDIRSVVLPVPVLPLPETATTGCTCMLGEHEVSERPCSCGQPGSAYVLTASGLTDLTSIDRGGDGRAESVSGHHPWLLFSKESAIEGAKVEGTSQVAELLNQTAEMGDFWEDWDHRGYAACHCLGMLGCQCRQLGTLDCSDWPRCS